MKTNMCSREDSVAHAPDHIFVCDTSREKECVFYKKMEERIFLARKVTHCHFREFSLRICKCEDAIAEAAIEYSLDSL